MTGRIIDDVREKMIGMNPGLTEKSVDQIIMECHPMPAWYAARWVDWLVSRAQRRERAALNSIVAVCRGLRFRAKQQKDNDPINYEDVLMRTLGSTPWDARPEMRVLTAMLKAATMAAEVWIID
jgi:hypothetical protein